ncbi:hypothetical protein [Arcobacter aquimarinus]|uniref:Uncharacterized protein n=1 Tax=Arcobacter aquimarinus TaxID=1315211 RepID=A0AAE7B214_9BACT|nr:hypothetical protein [Arcobacter aquimarinus]QKE25998.1 hypothetical protein AAQM_1247 [Arcobacter aquimarinus]RXI36633.1 hypothetical protein CP986_01415 [Arcobacter aquimarinus]
MNEFDTEHIISSVAIIVSTIALAISWRTMTKTSQWQKTDILIRQKTEERQRINEEKKRLAPYMELVNSTYHEFDNLFSEYSTAANQFYSEIVSLADIYNNGKGTNNKALRHHMCDACDIIIEEVEDNILLQHPEYLFTTVLNRRYRRLDYKLDLKQNKNLNKVEYNLKVLHENMNSKDKNLYLKELIKRIEKVNNIYKKNKDKIDSTINKLEEAIKKYKYYDFDTTINEFYLDFKSLLNLFLYIRKVSTNYTEEYDEDFYYLTLSEILYKLSSIMIVNHGILKTSKY